MSLRLRDDACCYDVAALGEVMLRLDPGEGRVRFANQFQCWEGGGEYNVAKGLRCVFGASATVITALVDNEIGRLLERLIKSGGVDTNQIKWAEFDGVGNQARNGINFTERGFGLRGALGVSDRGHTAAAALTPNDFDFDELFGGKGVRWLHTGGVFAGLSSGTAEVVLAAVRAARRHGAIISYDLNFRPSLWRCRGGMARARELNAEIVRNVDVLIGNEEDFMTALGVSVPGVRADLSELPVEGYATMLGQVADNYDNLQVLAATLRRVETASRNDWGAVGWSRTDGIKVARMRTGVEILDRVGGGDAFVAGLIAGFLNGQSLEVALNWGAAHGALAMTTPGDTSMATMSEVLRLVDGGNARVTR